ncbi:hypothetical protein FCR2A7T_05650 [Flavobacterium cauense R2A-7]|nr:hypothetical protein FCR2A7T_05650 [Flavobacterium cauense R2A-7]
MIVLNGISTIFTQIILSITILKIVITIAIVIMSIFFLIKLKKIEVEKVE